MISVRSASGERALLSDYKTSMSCQVGIRCAVLRSLLNTCRIAGSCSNTRATIVCIEPHLVWQACMLDSIMVILYNITGREGGREGGRERERERERIMCLPYQ